MAQSDYNPFPAIMEGLSQMRQGFHEGREMELKQDELDQKNKDTEAKTAANERFAQIAEQSNSLQDPALAGASVRAGHGIPGGSYKNSFNFGNLIKAQTMDGMNMIQDTVIQAGKPGADPKALQAQIDAINSKVAWGGKRLTVDNNIDKVVSEARKNYKNDEEFNARKADVDEVYQNEYKPFLQDLYGDKEGQKVFDNVYNNYYSKSITDIPISGDAYKNFMTANGEKANRYVKFEKILSTLSRDQLSKTAKDPTLDDYDKYLLNRAMNFRVNLDPISADKGIKFKMPTMQNESPDEYLSKRLNDIHDLRAQMTGIIKANDRRGKKGYAQNPELLKESSPDDYNAYMAAQNKLNDLHKQIRGSYGSLPSTSVGPDVRHRISIGALNSGPSFEDTSPPEDSSAQDSIDQTGE